MIMDDYSLDKYIANLDQMSRHPAAFPILIYLIFSLMMTSIFFSSPKNSSSEKSNQVLVFVLLVIFLWSCVIYVVCVSFGTNWGWFLVFLPYVVGGLGISMLNAYDGKCMSKCINQCTNN